MVVDFTLKTFFSNQTIVAKTLSSDMPGNMKHSGLSKRKDILKLKIASIITLTRSLMLSSACRVHKVQGLSLNSTVISFNLENLFSQGQMYVALSRVTDIKILPQFLELVLNKTSN